MKKLLFARLPIIITAMSLLIVSGFLRYHLSLRSKQIIKEFKSQNMHEIYSIDTLKISSRLNSYSASINWVCIEAEVNEVPFFKMIKGKCSSGLFTQREVLLIKEANNFKIAFTIQLERDIEILYILFLIFQSLLIISLIFSTKISESEKRKSEHELIEFARQTYHDIRSPLDVLKTVLRDKNSLEENQVILNRSLTRINEIASGLLEKTRSKNTILVDSYKPSKSNLNLIALEIVGEKRLLFPNVCLNIKSKNEAIWADIDPIEFKRVLSNLLNNSIEAGSSQIYIELNLNDQKEPVLKLIDNGPGFPKEILEKSELGNLTSKESGNGLGLSYAYKFAKLGHVKFSLKNLEIGSEILFQFNKSQIETSLSGNQVILLDDDSLTRLNWELKAKQNHKSLRTFSLSNDLFTEVNSFKYEDFIYVDCELKNESGVDVAKKLNSMGFQNIFLCTGHPPENFAHLTFLKGVIGKSPPF